MKLLAGIDIERTDAMPYAFAVFLAWCIAPALLGDHMDDHRSAMFSGNSQHPNQIPDIVSVDRTHVFQIEFSEDALIHQRVLDGILEVLHAMIHDFAELALIQADLHIILEFVVASACPEPCKASRHSTYIAGDGHIVVIEDNHHIPVL